MTPHKLTVQIFGRKKSLRFLDSWASRFEIGDQMMAEVMGWV